MGCGTSKSSPNTASTPKPAFSAKATEIYAVDAEKMWEVMRDWEAAHIVELGPATIEDVKGKGIGATRTVCFPGPDGSIAKWGEKVTSFDDKGMSWSYVLTSELPFPLKIDTFVCTFAVKSLGAGKCEASISCVYDSDAPDQLPPMNSMYKSWIDKAFEWAGKSSTASQELAAGRPTIHIVWRVPASDEAEIDAYWKGHEEWMRKSHVMGGDGDDAAAPRLTSFSINKGKELNNPLDPASGETGNLLYIMSETYVSAAGIGSHMKKGGEEWSGMAELGGKHEKYGVFMEAGACSVLTNLGD